jgi:hypothetical protein
MILTNPQTLIDFINTNFENLTNKQYSEVLERTLKVYVDKPPTKNEAIELIISYSSMSIQNRPLFD